MKHTNYIMLLGLLIFSHISQAQNKRKIILDADTANEVDDLFAVTRALLEPSWQIEALNATQWQASQWATERTMEDSHRLNQVLTANLKPENTKPRPDESPTGDKAWF